MAGIDEQAEFICAICHDEFKDAVIIQCHHSFCRRCITEWIHHDNSSGTYTCPTCKAVNELVPLQKSFHVEQMRAIAEKTKKQAHLYPQCDKHPDEDLRFYCRNCQTTVCRDCKIVVQHKGHDFETVQKVAAEMKSVIKKNIEDANKDIVVLKAEGFKLDDIILSAHQEEELAIGNCIKRGDELKSAVETLTVSIVDRIKANVTTGIADFNETKRALETDIHNIESYIEQLTNCCASENDSVVFSNYLSIPIPIKSYAMKENISQQLSSLHHKRLFERNETNLTHLQDMFEKIQNSVSKNSAVTHYKYSVKEVKRVEYETPAEKALNPVTVCNSYAACRSMGAGQKPFFSWRNMLKPVSTPASSDRAISAEPFDTANEANAEQNTLSDLRLKLKSVNSPTEANFVTSDSPVSSQIYRTVPVKPPVTTKPVTSRRKTFVPTLLNRVLPPSETQRSYSQRNSYE